MGPKLLLYIWEEPKAPWRQGLEFSAHGPARQTHAHAHARRAGGVREGLARTLTCGVVGSPARLVRRLRMLRSDICRRAATGGMRDSMEGRRVTSAFMSLSSSSSWFRTGRRGRRGLGPLGGAHCAPRAAPRPALPGPPSRATPPGRRQGFPKERLPGAPAVERGPTRASPEAHLLLPPRWGQGGGHRQRPRATPPSQTAGAPLRQPVWSLRKIWRRVQGLNAGTRAMT